MEVEGTYNPNFNLTYEPPKWVIRAHEPPSKVLWEALLFAEWNPNRQGNAPYFVSTAMFNRFGIQKP